MPRKKPFSIKQKKKQLQDKRERKRGKLPGGGSSSQSRNGSHERPAQFSDTSDTDAPSVRKMNEQPNAARPTEGYDPNRFRLHFERESRDEIERRKRVSREHVLRLVSEKELEVDVDEIYRPGSVLDFPRRPPWSYNMSREALWTREERVFEKYLKEVHDAFPSVKLSYFEHNLEVSSCQTSTQILQPVETASAHVFEKPAPLLLCSYSPSLCSIHPLICSRSSAICLEISKHYRST
uniref:Uncharacterized protein n=1 Tax=Eptatretus burgeri TaxID=7764 RepID=A0A8C4NNN8_EPTBU